MSRAYRKASLGVHPDKNPAPEARRAFDALKEAHKLLQNGASRREYEQREGERLLQKVAAERPEELVRMKRAREAQEAAAFADDVRAQAVRQAERCVLHMPLGVVGCLICNIIPPPPTGRGCASSRRRSGRRSGREKVARMRSLRAQRTTARLAPPGAASHRRW